MSKYLVNRGHSVTVFSFTGSHYLLLKRGSQIVNDLEVHEGVTFNWFRSLYQSDNFLIRIFNWQWFNWQLRAWFYRNRKEKPDTIVFSIPAIHHLRLMSLAKSLFPNAKIVFEIQDIWPLSIKDLGRFSWRNPIISRMRKLERTAFKLAQEVIAVQPGIKNYVKNSFSFFKDERAHFVPHAFVNEQIKDVQIEYDIGYAGTISRANDIETLIRSLIILKADYALEPKVLIIGTGSSIEKVKALAKKLNNITFHKWLPRSRTLELLNACRICFDGLLDLPMYQYGFSRLKWVDYMLLKKPILACYSGAQIDVVINKIGWNVPAQNPALLAKKIKEIFSEINSFEINEKGEAAFEFLKNNRRIEELGPYYEQILLD